MGAVLAVEHLLSLGHRRIGMVTNEDLQSWWWETGFAQALANGGLPPDDATIVPMPPTIDGWSAGSGSSSKPSLMSLRCLRATISWPSARSRSCVQAVGTSRKDVAVVGFDDIPRTEFMIPPITTVRLNREQVGAEAVNLAIALADDPTQEVPSVVLPVSLIRRTSA